MHYPFERRCPFQEPREFAELRAGEPVAPVTLPSGAPGYLVTTYDEVRRVLSDDRFSRTPVRERAGGGDRGGFDFGLSVADPVAHERWRRLVGSVVNPRLAETLRPRIVAAVEELLDRFAATEQPVDLMAGYARPLALRVLGDLFDVPDDLRPMLTAWAAGIAAAGADMTAFGAATQTLHRCATELVARPHGSLLAALAAARHDGHALTEADLVRTVMLMAIAGYETSAVQIGNGVLALLQYPEQLGLVRDGQVGGAVDEILRYAQAGTGFAGITYTLEEVELGGVTVPAGAAVLVCLDSAARDERRVPDPQRFDITRGSARYHLAFGSGGHYCLGAPVARVELEEGLTRLCRRFPGLRAAYGTENVVFARNLLHHYPRELPVLTHCSISTSGNTVHE
ncbi:cytochrome P450 [Actinoplanes xinjiangensis]|uniref:Cytochrome P450 n=1 Tax=Actinoplanes xinjiangensis TaxID=512350 RepID=A0A316EQN3_9ACTN|nr:cytochrome P450 [Actinoplanes xinjiangensis]PWK33293.1 cytochrome P450 [Actinoplanes xinjiangensis]GIF43468.1 cytochrome P450 [Actinoplanes xinjiangensis]